MCSQTCPFLFFSFFFLSMCIAWEQNVYSHFGNIGSYTIKGYAGILTDKSSSSLFYSKKNAGAALE